MIPDRYRCLPSGELYTVLYDTVKTEDSDLLLIDYASCGKNRTDERNRISVWLHACMNPRRDRSIPDRSRCFSYV